MLCPAWIASSAGRRHSLPAFLGNLIDTVKLLLILVEPKYKAGAFLPHLLRCLWRSQFRRFFFQGRH